MPAAFAACCAAVRAILNAAEQKRTQAEQTRRGTAPQRAAH
jgi:hypothetical protein